MFMIAVVDVNMLQLFRAELSRVFLDAVNPLMPTLKLHSNVLLYSNTVIGTVAVDGWAVIFGTAKRGLGWAAARPGPSLLYQM